MPAANFYSALAVAVLRLHALFILCGNFRRFRDALAPYSSLAAYRLSYLGNLSGIASMSVPFDASGERVRSEGRSRAIPGRVSASLFGQVGLSGHSPDGRDLVSITGQLMNEVKFAGGLLGHLEKGGQFSVKRTEIAPGQWEVTEMAVNMRGKARLFKTISVQQKELHRNFDRVPDDLTISDAAAILLKQSLIAERR
jgi:hypothetical protein